MKELLKIIESYNKKNHIDMIKNEISEEKINWSIIPIYSKKWENADRVPYEIITYLIDAYSNLPVRTDLAFLFCWQAFNNSYNQILLKDSCSKNKLSDTAGIEEFIDLVLKDYNDKYEIFLKEYILNFPSKLGRYMATYILKGYVIKNTFKGKPKYYNNSYDSLKKKFPNIIKTIEDTYGNQYNNICHPKIEDGKVKLNITNNDKTQSIQLIQSLSNKIKELLTDGEVEIEDKVRNKMIKLTIGTKDKLGLLIYGVIYSCRCNNFHGNIASRLNSIYSKREETYETSKYLFLLTHMFIGIALYINNHISEECLYKLKDNEKILII